MANDNQLLKCILLELKELNSNPTTALLQSIIDELQVANVTLSSIDATTTTSEQSLQDIIVELQSLITISQANNTVLNDISTDLTSIITRLDAVNNSLDSIEADTTVIRTTITNISTQLTSIQTLLQSEFDQTQVILNQILNRNELDQVTLSWSPLCVDGVVWYVSDIRLVNNTTGATVGAVERVYKQGLQGSITATAPTGTIVTEGLCTTPIVRDVYTPIDGGGQLQVTSSAVSTLGDGVVSISSGVPFTIPTNAVGLRIQVRVGDVLFTENDLTPDNNTPGLGLLVTEGGFIYLGETSESNNDISELVNAKFISPIGQSTIMELTYYSKN